MADQFSRMYDFERVGGDQRQRLAEMLRANALNQPQGQMVSGWYVPPSMTQNLNQLAQTALGTYMGAQIDEERKAKTAELLRELGQGVPTEENKLARIPGIMPQQGEGQSTPTPLEETPANQSMAKMPQYRPLTEEEKIGKVMELAQYNPYAAQIWSAQDTARQNRLTRAEERAIDREFKREQLQAQLEGKRDMMKFAASLRQPTGGGEQWKYDAGSDTWVMPPNAQFPMGRSTPNVGKVSSLQNIDYLSNQMLGTQDKPGPIYTATTGGPMGVAGLVGSVTNSQEAKAFDNKVEQLSTEMRKVFRIPGEGALSDKEQAQYGIQLPKRGNDPALNVQILQDLNVRAKNQVLPGNNPLQSAPVGNAGGWGIRPK